MKDRLSHLVALLPLILLLVGFGCVSAEKGDDLDVAATPTGALRTKTDVYMRFGVPEEIRVVGEDLYLFYDIHREMGSDFGIGTPAANFYIGRIHRATDTVLFVIDSKGRVKNSRFLNGSNIIRRGLWPFGT
jgi:hypothetical protein